MMYHLSDSQLKSLKDMAYELANKISVILCNVQLLESPQEAGSLVTPEDDLVGSENKLLEGIKQAAERQEELLDGFWAFIKGIEGQATAGGIMFTMIIVLIGAVLIDVYNLHSVRNFAYGLAADAALVGANLGRDFTGYYEDATRGLLRLDEAEARDTALACVTDGMAARGITGYTALVEVITSSSGGTVTNFPPVSRASLAGITSWSADGPAVGVYLVVPVQTNLFGLVNGGQPVRVHAFAASEVVHRQE